MSTWQPDEPITLGNGLLVCGAHHQIICTQCCVDYSFVLDLEDDEEETAKSARAREEDDGGEDDVTPQQLFPPQHIVDREFPRFVHQTNPREILIYTDGACLNNGQPNSAAGWAFVFCESEPRYLEVGRVMGRLEDYGPSGERHPQTSNRAELRAVIAALQFRAWFREGWTRLVIATDSEYVTKGATKWVRTWRVNGWVTSHRTAVQNRDLWEELLGEIIGYQRQEMEICFWRIQRAWNRQADDLAKEGARGEQRRKFGAIVNLGV